MRSDESAATCRPLRRVYDADEVDSYVGFLLATVEDLQAQEQSAVQVPRPGSTPANSSDAEAELGQILVRAQCQADDILSAGYRDAGMVLARAATESEACLAEARLEADRLVVEARRAIETFLRTWDDQLCHQVSEARRRMFGGFGRSAGPRGGPAAAADPAEDEARYRVTIESRLQFRVRGRSRHRRAGPIHTVTAPAGADAVTERSASGGR